MPSQTARMKIKQREQEDQQPQEALEDLVSFLESIGQARQATKFDLQQTFPKHDHQDLYQPILENILTQDDSFEDHLFDEKSLNKIFAHFLMEIGSKCNETSYKEVMHTHIHTYILIPDLHLLDHGE